MTILALINTIALASGDSSILISRFILTRKQCYSRMSDMVNAGLITRKSGKYFLTSFGKVVYEAQELIGKAVQHFSKLKAIDSIESPEFPASELSKLIDTRINNSQIKEILISRKCYNIENEIPYNKEQVIPFTEPRLSERVRH
jgi:predicted transcriptional regulator